MNLQSINASASPEVQMNENFETLDHQSVYGLRQPVTTGLTWGYCGGRWGGFSIAAGTLALTDDDDNYIVVEIATGDISVDTATTDWADDANFVRVYKITTADGVVTAVEDHRAGTGGVHGGGGGGGGGGGITALTGDVTASGSGSVAATIANDAVTYAKMQNVSATARVLGRKTASAGDTEEVTLSELLDFIGSAAQGDILYRDSSGWARLGAGTSGHFLKTQGAAANPTWAAPSRSPSIQTVSSSATVTPTFSDDMVKITAQAAALALANPTGTAIPGLGMVIRIKDNGTARAITYDTQYRAIGVTLPTTTVIGKTLYLALVYNSDDTKWDVVAVGQEA